MYMYICIYRRFRGASTACPTPWTGKLISIWTSTSIRSCVAGEAKLCVCVCVRCASLTPGLILGSYASPHGGILSNSCCYTHWF